MSRLGKLLGVVTGLLAPHAWILLSLAAVLDFLAGDVFIFLNWPGVPDSLTWIRETRTRSEPILANAALITSALTLVLLLPTLARGKGPIGKATGLVIILGLGALGLNTILQLAPARGLITAQNVMLCIIYGIVAAALLRSQRRGSLELAAFTLALIVPQVWRLHFEFTGGSSTWLRQLGDATLVLTPPVLLLLPGNIMRQRLLLLASAVPPILLLIALILWPDIVRDVLARATNLWLTTLPNWMTLLLLPLGLFAVMRLLLDTLFNNSNAGPAVAMLLWGCAGFMPLESSDLLLSFIAASVLLCWAQGRAGTREEMVRLLG